MKQSFRLFAFAALMLLATQAQAGWDGTSLPFAHGNGTATDPWLVETSEHLAYMSDMVISGANDFDGQYIKLACNISLSNLQWEPIGNKTHPFKGNLDGSGHTIDSVYAVYTIPSQGTQCKNYIGLFGHIENALVENIQLNIHAGQKEVADHPFEGNSCIIGGIAALAENSIIRFCSTNGQIESDMPVSAIAGNNSMLKVYGVAGIVGIAKYCILQFNENHCSVRGTYIVGGIAGRLDSTTVFKCINTSNITASTYNLFSRNKVIVGGIAGTGTKLSAVIQCWNSGEVVGVNYMTGTSALSNYSVNVSGICRDVTKIVHCYNTGAVNANCCGTSNTHREYSYMYGIGYADTIRCCYNVGAVGCSEFNNRYGVCRNGNETNNYYLETCFGESIPSPSYGSQGGMARTEAQMKSPTFPTMLNGGGEEVYVQDIYNENDGYPVFNNGGTGPYRISVATSNATQGSVQVLTEPTTDNPTAVVVAIPISPYRFSHWSNWVTENPYTLTLTSDTTLVAYFTNSTERIEKTNLSDILIRQIEGGFIIDGADGETVRVTDVQGRCLYSGKAVSGAVINITNADIIMITVGNRPAKKLINIKQQRQ